MFAPFWFMLGSLTLSLKTYGTASSATNSKAFSQGKQHTGKSAMTASRLKYQTSGTDCWRIDTGLNRPGHTACYLLHDAGELALIDTGTSNNIPALLGTLQELGFTPHRSAGYCLHMCISITPEEQVPCSPTVTMPPWQPIIAVCPT